MKANFRWPCKLARILKANEGFFFFQTNDIFFTIQKGKSIFTTSQNNQNE